jgi:hypothetical protein
MVVVSIEEEEEEGGVGGGGGGEEEEEEEEAANKSTSCDISPFKSNSFSLTKRDLSALFNHKITFLFAILNLQTTLHTQFTAKCMTDKGTQNYNFLGCRGGGGSI